MMEIKVTKTHIRLGKNETTSNTKCPVARAFKTAGFKDIFVGVELATTAGSVQQIELPENVQVFIREKLCAGLPMEPFSFKLTAKQVKTLRG